MPAVRIRNSSGDEIAIDQPTVERLATSLRGSLLTPESAGYDAARTIWNAMVDRRPALIARAASAADVVHAVRFAREHELLLAIRGGGHNIAGNAVCDGGLMIDLSPMKSIRVDPRTRTASVEPGCTLGDLDHDTQTFGLATPVGINSTTGVAGLTLGGGFGWISRKFGMTVDNLRAADVVTADGELVSANDIENEDLFWAIRGGGGNFGVVTSFAFGLHRVGPEILSGLIVHPFADARPVLRHYRDFAAQTPDELVCWTVLRKAPPLPFLAPEVHGTEVVVLAVCYVGEDLKEGERLLEPLRRFGRPHADVIGPHPYIGWQKALDPLLTPGARNYWKSHNLARLDDGFLDTIIELTEGLPSPQCELFVGQIGGAAGRVAPDATAYAHRDAEYVMNVHARWETPAEDERCIRWSREVIDTTAMYATGGVYVNFLTADEAGRVQAAYGPNYAQLAMLKNKYDPTNLFRMNQNVRPVTAGV